MPRGEEQKLTPADRVGILLATICGMWFMYQGLVRDNIGLLLLGMLVTISDIIIIMILSWKRSEDDDDAAR